MFKNLKTPIFLLFSSIICLSFSRPIVEICGLFRTSRSKSRFRLHFCELFEPVDTSVPNVSNLALRSIPGFSGLRTPWQNPRKLIFLQKHLTANNFFEPSSDTFSWSGWTGAYHRSAAPRREREFFRLEFSLLWTRAARRGGEGDHWSFFSMNYSLGTWSAR